jgi:hypothetical protein
MSSHKLKHTKDETLLASVAESIGSTLGTIAAKASAVPDALSHTTFLQAAEREGKKFVRRSRTLARKFKGSTSKSFMNSKLAKATRRGLRHAATAPKRLARPSSSKMKAARRGRRKK